METRMMKILMIDDNQDNLTILKTLILEAFPETSVLSALNGEKGIELAVSEEPDIILLDIIMPGLDGYEVCRKLKADEKSCGIPVVFVTAIRSNKDSRIRALECGAEAFLTKPIDDIELTAQIRAMLKIRVANIQKRDEKQMLAALVEEKTRELQAANTELKQSEERFQLLFNRAPLGYQALDFDGRFIEVNQQWLDTLGYRRDEVIGKWFGDFLCSEYVEGFRKRFPIFKAQGFIHSEFEMLAKNGNRLFIAFEGRIGYDAGGNFLQTHCILKDITEQRKAEAALKESEERYRYLFEYSGVGIGYYTTDGVVISYNQKALENIGGKLDDYVGKSVHILFQGDQAEIYFSRIKQAISSDDPQVYEDYIVINSQTKWFSSIFTRVSNEGGEIIGIQIASLDITQRKQAEETLHETEEMNRLLLDHLQVGIVVHNADSSISFCNSLAEQILGLSANQIQNKLVADKVWHFCDKFGKPLMVDAYPFSLVYKNDKALVDYEMGIVFEGSRDIRWLLVNGFNIKDSEGNITKVLISFVDTTEKKAAEKALNESEERYKYLFENSGVGIGYYTPDGVVISYNQVALKNMGGQIEDFAGKSISKIFPKAEADKYLSRIKKAASCDKPQEYEDYLLLNDGPKWYSSTFSRVLNLDKKIIGVQIASLEITDRKQAEASQKESEEKAREAQSFLQAAFDNSQAGIAIADAPDGKLRYVNKAGLLIRDKSSEEIVKGIDVHQYVSSWNMLHPDGTPYMEDEVPLTRAVLYGETSSEEFMIRRDNNEDRIVLAKAAPIKDAENNIKAGIVVFLDTTEKRHDEEKLKRQNEVMESLFKVLPVGVFMVDAVDGKPLLANEMAKDLLGIGILPDANQKNLAEVYKARKKGCIGPYPTEEMPIVKGMEGKESYVDDMVVERPDGTEALLEIYGTNITDEKGKTWASLVTFSDITERKRIELSLRESEKLFRTSFESATVGGAMVAKDGAFIEVNDKACEIWGYGREELLRLKFTDITFKEDLVESIDLITKLLSGLAKNYTMEKRYVKKDGSIIWGLVSVSAIRDDNDEFEYFLAYIQNITEMKESENSLKYMSYHDHLTGLHNRRYFEEELSRLEAKMIVPLTIIMGDINGLKIVNDSFGHAVGDDYLKKASDIIKTTCRASDTVVRLGGDEFAVILPNSDSSEAIEIIDRIKNITAETKLGAIELSISFGFATKEIEKQSVLETVISAENNMYTHKTYERSSMRSKTIDIIMNTLFEKSKRELQHSKRVSAICESIASQMNYSRDEINQIKTAGLLHDIGKIGIKESILNKDGCLDNEEWIEIRRHPEAGWRILSTTIEFQEIAKFAQSHHERFDGSGYPNGLKGEEIPIQARIIAIADAYDAMTSERSYRKAISHEKAIEEIKRCSGTYFDPAIVDVFVR